jgi:carbamoyltransferase
MNILGVFGLGEGPGACLVRDGRLVAMAEEERFTRLKGSHGMFPSRAIAWLMGSNGLCLEDVDRIAFSWNCRDYPWRVARRFARTFLRHRARATRSVDGRAGSTPFSTAGEILLRWHPAVVLRSIEQGMRAAGLAGRVPPVEFVDHHLAHAYSTYQLSGFDRAGILTLDGSGELTATQLALGENGSVRVLERFEIPDSLGWFYAAITQYLGFVPYRDEGKLMGLAALGEERRNANVWLEPLSEVLRVGASGYAVDPIYTHFGAHHHGDRFTDALADLLTAIDPRATPIAYGEKVETAGGPTSRYLLDHYVDIAWAAQELLERAAVMLARRLVREQGVEDLCLAGGVALNCKMNGEVLRRSGARRIFVQPASNDCGSALGAALYVAHQLGENVRRPLEHVFYGPGFDNDEIRNALEACNVSYRAVEDPSAEAARLLEQEQIIGWFQGRMEFGARALGGRSILASPLQSGMRDRVNREVKYRESWRPFCPSLAAGVEATYLEDPGQASFMIVAYEATPACRSELPAVVHVDGTVRPQVVSAGAHPRFHALIEEFGRRTGHPVVLNTSLNVRSEPIVCTPLETIRCFFSNGLQALVIGDFVVSK